MAKFKQLLIIDDSEMDSFVTKIVVERVKLADSVICVTNAYNGLEYIQTLKAKAEREKIPIAEICVFLDIMMPFMNANDFLKSLEKSCPALIGQVYIVSGLTLEEQYQMVNREDIAGFLSKPINDEKLKDIFCRKELN